MFWFSWEVYNLHSSVMHFATVNSDWCFTIFLQPFPCRALWIYQLTSIMSKKIPWDFLFFSHTCWSIFLGIEVPQVSAWGFVMHWNCWSLQSTCLLGVKPIHTPLEVTKKLKFVDGYLIENFWIYQMLLRKLIYGTITLWLILSSQFGQSVYHTHIAYSDVW